MRVRKNARFLSPAEKRNFIQAVLTLKAENQPGVSPTISKYDYFVAMHLGVPSVVLVSEIVGGSAPIRDYGHGGAGFLAWHREYLIRFENALRATNPAANITIPYWDWSGTTAIDTIFTDDFMGPNGGTGGVGGGDMASGYLAFDAPSPPLGWWPTGLPGFRVRRSLGLGSGSTHLGNLNINDLSTLPVEAPLVRDFGVDSPLPNPADVEGAMIAPDYNGVVGFRPEIESTAHSDGHIWHGFTAGAHMANFYVSPNDPMFWLHHANIDRLWAMWQLDGHEDSSWFPDVGGTPGHNRNDRMWPWGFVAGEILPSGISGEFLLFPGGLDWPSDLPYPDESGESDRHPADVIDHRAMGYSYDTEVVLGIALDRSFSMTGVTPAPVTGSAPDVPKWDAAKQAIELLLLDCEAAYTAREAYITAGVLTFTTNATGEVYDPVFPGTPYGLVKSGSYDGPNFAAAASAAGLAPEGNTPLAGALNNTESQIVRAALPSGPADDPRYLAILTDGKEYPAGPLAAMADGSFPNTRIFAMGFGIGGGWDGIDQGTVDSLVLKGTPPESVVPQSFFGGTFEALNKFFTNTIAEAIGYVPENDPRYELVAGQHVGVPFYINNIDDSFMIVAQGYDFTDKNWSFMLMGPDSKKYASSTTNPVAATFLRRNGRCTIFLSRGNADDGQWLGRWVLRARYIPGGGKFSRNMLKTILWDAMLPAGALPTRGPVFANGTLPAKHRPPSRLFANLSATHLERVARFRKANPNHPEATAHPKMPEACLVSVDIYARTRLSAAVEIEKRPRFAGDVLEVRVRLQGLLAERLSNVTVAARLIAPAYSVGNAYADLKTISPARRIKQFAKKGSPEVSFDEIAFLAEYERRKPGAFPMRDEAIEFVRDSDGTFVARISENRFPGTYRLGVMLRGTLKNGDRSSMFTKVLGAHASFGILPDLKKSQPRVHWLGRDRLVLSFQLVDRFGNVPSPAGATAPIVYVNGVVIESIHHNSFTGIHHLEIDLKRSRSRSKDFKLRPDFSRVLKGHLVLDAPGEAVKLGPDDPFTLAVNVGGHRLKAVATKYVGDITRGLAFEVASAQAMKIPLEHRHTFLDKKEARNAGFKL